VLILRDKDGQASRKGLESVFPLSEMGLAYQGRTPWYRELSKYEVLLNPQNLVGAVGIIDLQSQKTNT